MNYLLDTCVVSELVAPRPNVRVVDWVRQVPEDQLCLSVITVGELQKGIEKLNTSRRKETLKAWLHNELLARFRNRLIALDANVLLAWGTLVAQTEAVGRVMPAIDSLIAASALYHGLTLVTRNEADFVGIAVPVLNPWQ